MNKWDIYKIYMYKNTNATFFWLPATVSKYTPLAMRQHLSADHID